MWLQFWKYEGKNTERFALNNVEVDDDVDDDDEDEKRIGLQFVSIAKMYQPG